MAALHAAAPGSAKGAGGPGHPRLYSHQVEAVERARRGENLVVVTATSSGKTLCYNLPVLETILHDRETRALYLYPINALVNDQLKGLFRLDLALGKEAVSIAKYTGGLSSDRRRAAREREPQIVLTTPELRHLRCLLWAETWASLWRNLRYVVVTKCTPTAACSAPTWPTCFGACAAWPPITAPRRNSSAARPPWPTRENWRRR